MVKMKKVRVTQRNWWFMCRKCHRFMGEVGKFCFATAKYHRGTVATYCLDCGKVMQGI